MKLTLTIIFALIVSAGMAQKKHKRHSHSNPVHMGDVDSTRMAYSPLSILESLKPIGNIGLSARVYGSNTSQLVDTTALAKYNDQFRRLDTVSVIAFCLDTATLETKFRKIYAVSGWSMPCTVFNHNFILYQEYLDADKKPITQYKVIYAIKR